MVLVGVFVCRLSAHFTPGGVESSRVVSSGVRRNKLPMLRCVQVFPFRSYAPFGEGEIGKG